MNTENVSGYLAVTDPTVNEDYPEKTHEIIVRGETIHVTFKLGEKKILPFEQAIKFQKAGFPVEDAEGNGIDLPVVPSDSVVASLNKDECVARFSELKTDALKVRAAQKAGGELYLDATEEDRKEIIAFLIGTESDTIDDEDDLIEDEEEGGDEIDVSDAPSPEEEAAATAADEQAKRIGALIEKYGAVRWDNDPAADGAPFDQVIVSFFGGEDGNTLLAHGTVAKLEAEPVPSAEPTPDTSTAEGQEGQPSEEPATDTAGAEGTAPAETDTNTSDGQPDAEEAPAEGNVGDTTFTLDQVEGATDEAMRLAAEHGIALQDVTGTGEDGNILVGDVEAYIEKNFPKDGEAEAKPDAE